MLRPRPNYEGLVKDTKQAAKGDLSYSSRRMGGGFLSRYLPLMRHSQLDIRSESLSSKPSGGRVDGSFQRMAVLRAPRLLASILLTKIIERQKVTWSSSSLVATICRQSYAKPLYFCLFLRMIVGCLRWMITSKTNAPNIDLAVAKLFAGPQSLEHCPHEFDGNTKVELSKNCAVGAGSAYGISRYQRLYLDVQPMRFSGLPHPFWRSCPRERLRCFGLYRYCHKPQSSSGAERLW